MLLEQIKLLLKDNHVVPSRGNDLLIEEHSDGVDVDITLLGTGIEDILGIKAEGCHSGMLQPIPDNHPLRHYRHTCRCCDYFVVTSNHGELHFLYLELARTLSNAIGAKQKFEQLACSKPLGEYLLSVVNMIREECIPDIKFKYILLYEKDGIRLPEVINMFKRGKSTHPRRIKVHRHPKGLDSGFFRYGSDHKHIYIHTRKISDNDELNVAALIREYEEFQMLYSQQ